jgi:hypothetical protein
MEQNLCKFLKTWQTVTIDEVRVLPQSAVNEAEKLLKHIPSGCLSNIPVGIGTNRNKRLHRKLRKWVNINRMGVSYAVAVLFVIFYNHMEQNEKCCKEAKGRARHVVSPVTKWYQSFLKNGGTNTMEKFGIGVGKVRDLPSDILAGSEDCNANLGEIYCTSETSSDEESGSECDTVDAATEIMSRDDANNIISRAKVMMNLAKEVFNKTQAPIMSHKSNWLDHASSLLLFSHPDNTVLCDYEKASQRLNSVVSNYGFEVLDVPGDGDCCFASVGYGIEIFFDLDPSPLTDHLKAINIYKNQDLGERVVRLRELVVVAN